MRTAPPLAAIAAPTLAMLAVLTTSAMCAQTVNVLAPVAAPDIGVAATRIGAYVALVYLVAMFTGAVTGTLVARHGPIRVCQATLLCAGAGMLALALATPATAALSAILLGCAYGPFNPASARVLGGLVTPRTQPLVFSVKQLGVPLGGALAGGAIPALTLVLGWRTAAAATGLLALCAVLLLLPLRARFDTGLRAARLSLRESCLRPVALALGDPALRRLTLGAFLYAGCQLCVGAFTVVYLTEALDMSLIGAGGVFACLQAGGCGGRLLWGGVAERWVPSHAVLCALGLLTAAGLLAMGAITPAWPMPAVLALATALGATSFGWNGVMLSQVATRAPSGLAVEATGGMQFVMFGGVVAVPPVFGAMVQIWGDYRAPFAFAAVLAVTGALLLLGRRRPAAAVDTPGGPPAP